MKSRKIKYFALLIVPALTIIIYSCNKALNKAPAGALQQGPLATKSGIDGLLIGAYSMLDGFASGNTYNGATYTSWETSTTNWVYGGIAADDAYKGSNTTDQPNAAPIENHSLDPSNEYLQEKWSFCYNAIQRANDVIREIPLVIDGSLTAANAAEDIAEARFLRGVFHLEAAKLWRNVPYVGDDITYLGNNYMVPNTAGPIWDSIEADFSAAMAVLPTTQNDVGRANSFAAEAFLAKTYMFDHQYAKALPLLTDVIANGTTQGGAHYAMGAYEDNFDVANRNNSESVFCVQMTTNDGSGGNNGDEGDALNFPAGTYTSCCGFYQPSYSLANSFKTDATGLPMFGTDPATGAPAYDAVNLGNDHGLIASQPFTPPTDNLDPRLDWTVGRRGIPYLDWGLCGGENWSRGDIVPYNPIKNVFWHSQMASGSDALAFGWAANQGTAINYNLIRLPDVILWRAECEVEANDLTDAETDVNLVRNRMAQHPEYWVHTYIDNTNPAKGFTSTPAANYLIKPYTGQFSANGQAYARLAVYMERQLEFGMEGHRFFDLQRYDGIYGGPMPTGYMATTLNAYIKADTRISNPVLNGHTFTQNKNELYPIPQNQVDIEAGKLKQNPGY
jgi:starch-binding outer membrane protein, SusD/RagB family